MALRAAGAMSAAPAPRPPPRPPPRKIVHVDMDAFYAAVEQRDNPAYAGKPLIVGGSPRARGVVATCSYEARAFGVHSAMSSARALRLCPEGIFIAPRFAAYRRASAEILDVFYEFTELVEPLSLDEAYLDLGAEAGSATLAAREIRRRIAARTRLTASAGVSYNKFIAKLASDINKPDGQFTVPPGDGARFVAALPVGRFHGVGRVGEKKLHALNIRTGADLRRASLRFLVETFGKFGAYLHGAARGLDERPVTPDRVRKSVGSETTFARDLRGAAAVDEALRRRAFEVAKILAAKELTGRTVTVKLRFDDFSQVTRSITLDEPLASLSELRACLPGLLRKAEAGARPVRLVGVAVSKLQSSGGARPPRQLDLLDEPLATK